MEKGQKSLAAVVAVAGVLVPTLLLAAYVVGYFALPIRHPVHRQFRQRWQAEIYKPAAAIEGFLTGRQIRTCSG
jgi:uncharacterized paraquat-inducible protein A